MTGFYKASLNYRAREANQDVSRLTANLMTLKNQNSEFAQEHRDLLAVLEKVAAIYNDAMKGLK